MGVKMVEAINKKTGEKVKVMFATKEMRELKQLKCSTSFCNANVTWAEIHKKYFDIKTRFYRLLPQQIHNPKCKFNTIGQILEIAAESSQDLIKSIGDKKYEFRLNIIFESLEQLSKLELIQSDDNIIDVTEKNDKKYIAEGKISPYLASMKKLMELRSKLEEDKELRELIELKLGNMTVKWNNLYYETENFNKCYTHIQKKGNKTKYGIYSHHPICVMGHILKIEYLESYSMFAIDLRAPFIKHENEIVVPTVSLHTKDEGIVEQIKKFHVEHGEYPDIAAYCIIQAKEPSLKENRTFMNMKGKVFHKHQIIIIEPRTV